MLKVKRLLINEKMGAYELEHKKASYRTLVNRFIGDLVLCNNIVKIDTSIWDNVLVGELYDEETESYPEIYQCYACNVGQFEIDCMRELTKNNNDIILTYSDVLDCNILMVDHYGTSWDYVLTNVELTDNYNEC